MYIRVCSFAFPLLNHTTFVLRGGAQNRRRRRRRDHTYDDGTIARVGDVVTVASGGDPERYIIIGPDQGNFAKLLLIGTVQKGRLTSVGPDHHLAYRLHSFRASY